MTKPNLSPTTILLYVARETRKERPAIQFTAAGKRTCAMANILTPTFLKTFPFYLRSQVNSSFCILLGKQKLNLVT